MSTDEDFIAEARAAAEAERRELDRTLAADRMRRSPMASPVRWLLHGLFEGVLFTLIAFLVVTVVAAVALSQTVGIPFQAGAVIAGLGAVVLMGLWTSLR